VLAEFANHRGRVQNSGMIKPILVLTLLSSVALAPGQDQTQPATQPSLPRALTNADTVITVDRSAGLLNTVCATTADIELHWPAVPHAQGYWVFRSDQPKVALGWGISLVGQPNTNSFMDDTLQPGTRYYYAIVSVPDAVNGKQLLVATGSSATLAKDEPLVGIYPSPQPTLPSVKLNVSDFVPREVFDEVASDRNDRANQLAQAQQEIQQLKAQIAALKAGQK
jgi:hypothetical protein